MLRSLLSLYLIEFLFRNKRIYFYSLETTQQKAKSILSRHSPMQQNLSWNLDVIARDQIFRTFYLFN